MNKKEKRPLAKAGIKEKKSKVLIRKNSSGEGKKLSGRRTAAGEKNTKLRVLILEDNAADAELMERQLKKDGIDFDSRLVASRSAYLKAVKAFKPDLILADYNLPKFDALQALVLRKANAPQVPFIIVTGSVSEEIAVECMRQGADDYLLKDRLARLGEAVRQALEKHRSQSEKVIAQEQIEQSARKWTITFDAIKDGMALLAADRTIRQANHAFADLVKKPFREIIGKKCYELIHSDKQPHPDCPFQKMLKSKKRESMEFMIAERTFVIIVDPIMNDAGVITGAVHILNDISERKQVQEMLLATSKRLELALNSAKAGTWDWNIATSLIEWSPQMFDLFGLDPRTAGASFESWRTALHPEDREQAESRIDQALKQHAILDSDYRIILPDGQVRWIHAVGIGVYDDAGRPIQMIGICQDISERKKTEAQIRASLHEKDILLKEIHHRVKNNLQIISGLLTLQSAQIDDERLQRIIKESQSRIWTMALIHQTLYQTGNLAAIDMTDYIRSLSGNLLSSQAQIAMPPNVIFDLSPLQLVIDKAIPLALIINELVTNTLKHAFPDGRMGEIRIALQERRGTPPFGDRACPRMGTCRAPNEETNGQYEKGTARRAPTDEKNTPTYELTVADNGIGLPAGFDAKNQKSLGLQLVTMLTKQIGGSLAIESSGGTSVCVTFEPNEKSKKQA